MFWKKSPQITQISQITKAGTEWSSRRDAAAPAARLIHLISNKNLRNLRMELALECRQVVRQHVAPIVPVVAAPFPVVEPMPNAFGVEQTGEPHAFLTRIIPLARPEDDAHVIEAPAIGQISAGIVGAVEVDVVVVVAAEESLMSNAPLRLIKRLTTISRMDLLVAEAVQIDCIGAGVGEIEILALLEACE